VCSSDLKSHRFESQSQFASERSRAVTEGLDGGRPRFVGPGPALPPDSVPRQMACEQRGVQPLRRQARRLPMDWELRIGIRPRSERPAANLLHIRRISSLRNNDFPHSIGRITEAMVAQVQSKSQI
jgi:hypothetical protein